MAQNHRTDSLKVALKRHLRTTDREGRSGLDTVQVGLLLDIAHSYTYFDSDSLGAYARKAADLTRSDRHSRWYFESQVVMANYYQEKGFYDKAIEVLLSLLESAWEPEFESYRLPVMNSLANIYSFQQSYNKALEFYLKGIEEAEKLENLEMLSVLNTNTAQLYESQKNFEEALLYYEAADRYNQLLGDELGTAQTLSNHAYVQARTGKFLTAMKNIDRSIDYFEKSEAIDWLAYATIVKAKIYGLQNRPGWAIHWFEKGRELYRKVDDPRSQIELFSGLGLAYFQVRELDSALNCARRSHELARRLNEPEGLRESASLFYKIYKEQGEVELALEQLEKLHRESMESFEIQSRNNLAMLETKSQFESDQQLEAVGTMKTASWKRILALVITIAFLALGTTIYFLIKHQIKQRKLLRELRARTSDLHTREKELKDLNKTKDQLFSVIGHDLRGPVGALQDVLNLYQDEDISSEELLMHLPKLRNDVDHVFFTLNNLLSWGQSQLQGTITKPRSITLRHRVEHTKKLLSQLASQKDIKMYSEVPETAKVQADSHHLDMILRNLLSNAIKFTPQHGLVHVEAVPRDSEWIIKVRDTGVGMDKDTVARLFTSKERFTTYGTDEEKGTGLGLSLCHELTVLNKGEIWVESEPGKGSTFYFSLPRAVNRKGKTGKNGSTSNPADPDSKSKEYAPR